MTTVYIFRHGLTKEAELHLYCGKTDVPLSAKGIELLQKQKEAMPDLCGYSFYSSGMKRTDRTLEILYPNAVYKKEAALRELDFGIFECHSYEELRDNCQYQMWISGCNELNVCPGGESSLQMKDRVISFAKKILSGKEEEKRIAIFTHGGPVVALMQYFFPEEKKNFYEWRCGFGQGYKIQLDDRGASYTKLEFDKEIK